MKIRKITLTIAGATLLAGSAAAITSAQASTHSPERHPHEWCHKTFGDDQHDLCNYYNWAKDAAHELRSNGEIEDADAYESQAAKALSRLYAEQKAEQKQGI
ncbi:hypothetical protein [Corynebacterium ulcerans]|uniref:hypothetical protein n=2 Tax=Corynebacterium ulcerans TaxID=65058 RepID=UPI000C78A62B|nr:hypothetical protein [Corynebacterium ulcerans]PLW03167.1 hypothetical protein BRL54_02310 [Corynebacterium ulcerans]